MCQNVTHIASQNRLRPTYVREYDMCYSIAGVWGRKSKRSMWENHAPVSLSGLLPSIFPDLATDHSIARSSFSFEGVFLGFYSFERGRPYTKKGRREGGRVGGIRKRRRRIWEWMGFSGSRPN